jgi:NitT/TauT family transport system ATP-binding protein
MNKELKILVEDVSKEFGADTNQVHALRNISLTVSEGEFVSIVGPFGCGKSTLLYMLGGFVPPSSGRLLADGQPIVGPGIDRIARFVRRGHDQAASPACHHTSA